MLSANYQLSKLQSVVSFHSNRIYYARLYSSLSKAIPTPHFFEKRVEPSKAEAKSQINHFFFIESKK